MIKTLKTNAGEVFMAEARGGAGERFLASLSKSMDDRRSKQDVWRDDLRERGVVVTHPDDGWVKRDKNTVHFCYPHILGKVEVGALAVLGTHEKYRCVRLLKYRQWVTGMEPTHGDWTFEEVPLPPSPVSAKVEA